MVRNRSRGKKRRLSELPLSRLFPNMITLGGLCCGLSSIRFAMEQRFEFAVAILMAAAIIDGMDGRIARILNATSTFGAQLDSLSDFLCFGVAPVIVMYLWGLKEIKGIGWAIVLFYSVCCALRLARFNTHMIEDEEDDAPIAPWKAKFFTGIPSPAGAMLCLLPLVTSFSMPGFFMHPILEALWVAFIGALMASRVPTFAVKKIRIRHEWVLAVMIVFCMYIVLMLVEPWIMFSLTAIVYCLSIPFSVIRHRNYAAGRITSAGSSLPE